MRGSVRLEAKLAGVAVALAGGFFLWLGTASPEAAKTALRWLAPAGIEAAWLVLLASGFACRRWIVDSLPRPRPLALGVALVALLAVTALPPRTHRIYYDEDIYENVAQNLLWTGRAQMCNEGEIAAGGFRCHASEYNKEPNGFPFLLSVAFRFTGVEETVAHRVNHVVFALGAVAVYWLGGLLFRRTDVALGAALVYVLVPENLLWGATVAAEPSASAFSALGLGAWILFVRRPSMATASFGASALALACQFRPESGLVLLVAAAASLLLPDVTALARPHRRELAVAGTVLVLLMLPHLGHLWIVRAEPWGSVAEAKFSSSYVAHNLRTNLAYHVEGRELPRAFTLLALLGVALPGRRREGALLLVWFALFFGVFIPFHAGSYRYGADIRFSVVSSAPFALLAGAGVGLAGDLLARLARAGSSPRRMRAVPLAVVVYAFTLYLPIVRAVGSESRASRADHETARRMVAGLPEDAVVLTHNPGMIQVMGRSAVQTSLATYRPERVDELFRLHPGGVYFHFNFWCNVPDPVQNAFCSRVLERYRTSVVHEESAGFERYVLYRLGPRTVAPPPLAPGEPEATTR